MSEPSYDAERQAEIDADLAEQDRREQRADLMAARFDPQYPKRLGLKEHPEYPGYYINDPRYQGWSCEDRYKMDHPGLDWRTKHHLSPEYKPMLREVPETPKDREPAWDEEQFVTEKIDEFTPDFGGKWKALKAKVDAQQKVEQQSEDQKISARYPNYREGGKTYKPTGLWLCQVCRQSVAIYPSEIAWRWKLLGLQGTVVFRSPLACPNCRIMRQLEVKRLGRENHRRTWMKIFALVTGEQYPTMSRRLARVLRFRNRLIRRRR